jgi:hypothetical protein
MNIPYEILRKHYEVNLPDIMERGKNWHDPYTGHFNWPELFTPIEENTWMEIRGFGMIPFYPQFPIGNYWVDFASPYFKLIIECDGKEYHKDKEKDKQRDSYFKSIGWKVFRVNGTDCYRTFDLHNEYNDDPSDYERRLKRHYLDSVEGLVKSLAILCGTYKPGIEEYDLAQQCLQARCTNATIELPAYYKDDNEEFTDDSDEDESCGWVSMSDIMGEVIEMYKKACHKP